MSAGRPRTARLSTRRVDGVPAPVVLDRYRLSARLGAGAFGTVWLARDERLERDVAVKILARDLIVSGRFEREARAAARLSHPGIVTLFEAAVDAEGAYLVSELVVGETLDTLLREGRLSDRDIVEVGVALCDALAHAHAQGVVHRDVKPSNVLVPEAPASRAQVAQLTDFGVAQVIDAESLTSTGDVVGTLAYMAPEQAAGGTGPAHPAADLYALALVLYEALTGVNPARGTAVTARQTARRFLAPVRRQRRDLPRELARALDAALAPRPDERGSIARLRDALEAAGELVGDEPGIVTDAWPATRDRSGRGEPGPGEPGPGEPGRAAAPPDPSRLFWQARALGAATTAAVTAWLSGVLLAPPPAPPAVLALAAAGLALLLPRLAWVATAVFQCAVAAIQGHAGGSLAVAIAAVVPMVLMPATPTAWPVSAVAPALGLIGLGGAWPAVAGYGRTPWRRAMLGATGWLWLLLAAPLAGRTLYLPGAPRPSTWTASPEAALHHLLSPLVGSGVVAPAAVWALAAVLAPWLRQGRSALLDIARVLLWSAAVAGGVAVAVIVARGSDQVSAAPTAAVGAVAGAVIVLAPAAAGARRGSWWGPWRGARRGGGPQSGTRPGSASQVP